MKTYHISTGFLGVNTYFLVNENGDAVMIDGGENYQKIKDFANKNGFNIKAELLTHAHFDHAGNAGRFQKDGVKIYSSKLDGEKLITNQTLSSRFECFTPDFYFSDGEELNLFGIKIKVIATPGHTDGSVCFLVDDMIFSGDTLFYECVGRTDFPTGDISQLERSIKKLYALSGDYKVYPGHEDFTTLSHERKFNQFFRE